MNDGSDTREGEKEAATQEKKPGGPHTVHEQMDKQKVFEAADGERNSKSQLVMMEMFIEMERS